MSFEKDSYYEVCITQRGASGIETLPESVEEFACYTVKASSKETAEKEVCKHTDFDKGKQKVLGVKALTDKEAAGLNSYALTINT